MRPPYVSRLNFGSSLLGIAIAAVSMLVLSHGALAAGDSRRAAGLPWTNRAHDTPLELLASRIASHIAGRPVRVDCETAASWRTLETEIGAKQGSESGYVQTFWNSSNGRMISSSNTARLAPGICRPLDRYATSQQTTCSTPSRDALGISGTPSPSAPAPDGHGKPTVSAFQHVEPCDLAAVKRAAGVPAAFSTSYFNDAVAILTLAHESVHLSGIVGGTLPNGLRVGDRQAEARADCEGMQWMPYVAEQLGATPDKAQSIAAYFWTNIYPIEKTATPAYWSQACRPGGPLDVRSHAQSVWP